MELGSNVTVEVEGPIIRLTIDTTQSLGLSKSMKSEIIGTTHGFRQVAVAGKSVGVSVNVTTPPTAS